MAQRRRSNALALAVLAALYERPMHPYEMATTMRERGKEASIKINYGTLYSVVQSLQKYGMIEALQTEREGRRPERTIYEITEAGKMELFDWLGDLISTPAKDPLPFESGLSLLGVFSPEEAVRLLRLRSTRLEAELLASTAMEELATSRKLARLFLVELEYRLVLQRAELEWVTRLVREIEDDTLDGLDLWREFHERHDNPLPGADELPGGDPPPGRVPSPDESGGTGPSDSGLEAGGDEEVPPT
jgi:DNA-binding PadR family transcriptional regulator